MARVSASAVSKCPVRIIPLKQRGTAIKHALSIPFRPLFHENMALLGQMGVRVELRYDPSSVLLRKFLMLTDFPSFVRSDNPFESLKRFIEKGPYQGDCFSVSLGVKNDPGRLGNTAMSSFKSNDDGTGYGRNFLVKFGIDKSKHLIVKHFKEFYTTAP